MDIFINQLKKCLKQPLPSHIAHSEMLPESRKKYPQNPKDIKEVSKSGVLLLFYQRFSDIFLVFIKRTYYNGVHSGQIAFPGGKFEPHDKSLLETAIREANEEIGVDKEKILLIGKLSELYIPPSNIMVAPYVGIYNAEPVFKPDKNEVEKIIEVAYSKILNSSSRTVSQVKAADGLMYEVPCFSFDNNIIWGATAMILNELIVLWKSV